MDPDGEYSRQLSVIVADQPPEPSAPPIDQECLLSAIRAASLDPPEEEGVTALAVERGRSHHLEPPGVADRMIDHVAATCATSSTSDANLPVASAVPIVTDAVGASTDTAKRAALTSSREHSSKTKASAQTSDRAAPKEVLNAQHKKVSLEELLRREKEQRNASHVSKTTGQKQKGKQTRKEGKAKQRPTESGQRKQPYVHFYSIGYM